MKNIITSKSGGISGCCTALLLCATQTACPPTAPTVDPPPSPPIPSVCSGDPCASSSCPPNDDVDCAANLPAENPDAIQVSRGFDCNDAYEGEEVATVAGQEQDVVLIRRSSSGNCNMDLIYRAGNGDEKVLSNNPSGYTFTVAGLTPAQDIIVCSNKIQHRTTEDTGIRFIERILVQCWIKEPSGTWIGPKEVVAPDGAWAAWAGEINASADGSRNYSIGYGRDFSFQFLNIRNDGRPATDGLYRAYFSVENGTIVIGETAKLADNIYPTADEVYDSLDNWIPTEEEKEAGSEFIDFSDGDCPPPNGCSELK
jgi:hypothetical protein